MKYGLNIVFGILFVLGLGLFAFRSQEIFIQHDCDVSQGRCFVKDSDIEMIFEVTPRPLDPSGPFSVSLEMPNQKIEKVRVTLFGIDFQHQPEVLKLQKVGTTFSGQSLFPFCTESKMRWRLHVIAKTNENTYKSNFDFEVKRE